MSIDWNAIGTLRHVAGGYDIRLDPLWKLVIAAIQGHEGSVEDMEIVMQSGHRYKSGDIRALAMRPDRKGAPWASAAG